jgi:hypothetical protein
MNIVISKPTFTPFIVLIFADYKINETSNTGKLRTPLTTTVEIKIIIL